MAQSRVVRERYCKSASEPADAAWCGLSIHHLSNEGKLGLLKAICGSTSAFLMIYEPTLNEGESREAYLERFRRVNRPTYPFLSSDEWEQIDYHVTTCDYPETTATWLKVDVRRGLGRCARSSAIRRAFTASIATSAESAVATPRRAAHTRPCRRGRRPTIPRARR